MVYMPVVVDLRTGLPPPPMALNPVTQSTESSAEAFGAPLMMTQSPVATPPSTVCGDMNMQSMSGSCTPPPFVVRAEFMTLGVGGRLQVSSKFERLVLGCIEAYFWK